MAMKKVKQGLAAALAAALVLQGAPMPVQAAQDAGAAVQGETVPGGKGSRPKGSFRRQCCIPYAG